MGGNWYAAHPLCPYTVVSTFLGFRVRVIVGGRVRVRIEFRISVRVSVGGIASQRHKDTLPLRMRR